MKRRGSGKEKDFPKKKRKLSKKKHESENATNISFKSKAIVLPSQLVPSKEPTTHRKVPMQTLLNQLNHFKGSMRSGALLGLRSFFQEHAYLLLPNLDKLVSQVMVTLIDAEPTVRSALFLLLNDVFPKITSENLKPFFSILEAHLSCGFTHINDQIQLDSLKVFKLVLSHFPVLLVPYASKQLPLLLSLISRQEALHNSSKSPTSSGAASKPDSAAVLSSKPNSRFALQTSRLEIFAHLSKYLEVLLLESEMDASMYCVSLHVDVMSRKVLCMKNRKLEEVHSTFCDFSGPIPHIPVVQKYGIEIPANAFLDTSGSIHHQTIFAEKEKFVEFARNLFSLVIECWVEYSPTIVLKSSAKLLLVTLNLLCLLLKAVRLVDRDQAELMEDALQVGSSDVKRTVMWILFEKFWFDFHKHVMSGFPFTEQALSQTPATQLLEVNFVLCHTVLLLLPEKTSPSGQPASTQALPILDTVVSVCQYIGGLANEDTACSVPQSCVKTLVEFLPMILKFKNLSSATLKKFLNGVWKLYNATNLLSHSKQLMTQCFNKLHIHVFSGKVNSRVVLNELLVPWLQTLPNVLVQLGASSLTMSGCVVDSIASAIVHRNPTLLESLQESFDQILDPDKVLVHLQPSTQRKVLELVWYLPRITGRVTAMLVKCVCCGKFEATLTRYIIQLVHQRLVVSPCFHGLPSQSSVSQYLSFMLSVAVGYSKDVMDKHLKRLTTAERSLLMLCDPLNPVTLVDRTAILNSMSECLATTSFLPDVLTMLESSLEKLIAGPYSKLPADTAMGLLRLTLCCLSSAECTLSKKLISLLSMLCLSCLVALGTGTLPGATSLVNACGQLTNEVLRASRPLLCALLVEFRKNWNYDTAAYDSNLQVKVFIYFLKSALFNSALRECKEEVVVVERQLVMQLSQDAQSSNLKHQLKLAATKFM